jgi:hypothetical protein
MDDVPEFAKLRAARDAANAEFFASLADQGLVIHVNHGSGSGRCYCACADGGPCEHLFTEARSYQDGNSKISEAICARCGMGTMRHASWVCD